MPPNKGCVLPAHPDSGRWIPVGNSSKSLSPGGRVDHLIILKIECNNGHILDGAMFFLCNGSEWVNKMGKCLSNIGICRGGSHYSLLFFQKLAHL
jgi:hypothetical protein